MEEFASYVQNVASKHNSRLININEKINSMQSLALIKNEKRNNLKIGLYFLISHNYKIVLKRNAKGNRKYQIVTEDKKLLCLRSTVHENDKKLKALFNGDHYKVTPAALFRLSIALSHMTGILLGDMIYHLMHINVRSLQNFCVNTVSSLVIH